MSEYEDNSENYDFINTTQPQVFTELEDNIVELMGGPINERKLQPSYEYLESKEEIHNNGYEDELKKVDLHDALKEYDYQNNGNEILFLLNNNFSQVKKYRSKRKGVKLEKAVANYENLDNLMFEMRNTKNDFEYNVSDKVDVVMKKEKRLCGNWEGENKFCAVKNGPKIIKKASKKKTI